MSETSYKGWTRPGQHPPAGLEPEPGETLDHLCGHFRIFQYLKGHRFSTDDILAAVRRHPSTAEDLAAALCADAKEVGRILADLARAVESLHLQVELGVGVILRQHVDLAALLDGPAQFHTFGQGCIA